MASLVTFDMYSVVFTTLMATFHAPEAIITFTIKLWTWSQLHVSHIQMRPQQGGISGAKSWGGKFSNHSRSYYYDRIHADAQRPTMLIQLRKPYVFLHFKWKYSSTNNPVGVDCLEIVRLLDDFRHSVFCCGWKWGWWKSLFCFDW